MKKKLARTLLVIAILAIVCSGLALMLIKSNFVRGLYNDLVLDSKDHFLSCDELPSVAEVEQVVADHQDTIDEIKQVSPGSIFVEIHTATCSGRADIVIMYGTHQNRLEIEQIIDGDTFFGVPYRLVNI